MRCLTLSDSSSSSLWRQAARDDFFNAEAGSEGSRDVDCVLSSGEVLQLLEEKGLSLAAVGGSEPDREPDFSGLSDDGTQLCYASPGGSGGHAEYVFRAAVRHQRKVRTQLLPVLEPGASSAWARVRLALIHSKAVWRRDLTRSCPPFPRAPQAAELFGIELASPLEWKAGRNADIAELILERDGQTLLKCAAAP